MINNHVVSYAEQRRVAANIPMEQNLVEYIDGAGQKREYKILDSDNNDNLKILYWDPYGNPCYFQNAKGANCYYYRTRLKIPKDGQKYHTPKGAEALPYLPPPLIDMVKRAIPIHRLWLTEGEIKALVGCLNGMYTIGIPGIDQIKQKGSHELHPFIREVVHICQVKEVVFLVDSDCLNLTSHDDSLAPERLVEKDLTIRPSKFYNAFKSFAEASRALDVNVYCGFIKPENGLKGLDDLLTGLPTESAEIVADAQRLTQASSYFTIVGLDDTSYFKLRKLFGINEVAEFYTIHAHKLKEHDFNYKGGIYRYNSATEKPEISENNYTRFWYEKDGKIKIDLVHFLQFLHENGFRLYRLDVDHFIYVRVQDNVMRLISRKDIKDFTCGYIQGLTLLSEPDKHRILHEILLYSSLFSDEKLNSLRIISNRFHTDTDKRMYFYFQNGFVEVSEDGFNLNPYSELTDNIWQNQILPHTFTEPKPEALAGFMFTRFVQNICSIKKDDMWVPDPDRLDSFTSILGYALHQKKLERRAIVLTDMAISDEPEGRTGKTIIGKALGKLRVYAEIDGKNFNPDDRFKYQKANVDTQIMHINDAGRGKKPFDFELVFTAITEGVTVEKKNQDSFTIHPTVLISSNRAIEINGSSGRARVIEFEFANYYSDRFKPSDDFGVWFFDQWTEQDWNLFYLFMFNCARSFLANGIVMPTEVNLSFRKLLQSTHQDFIDFAETHFKPGESFAKSKLLADFKEQYPEFDKLTSQGFTKWLKAYARFKKWELAEPDTDKKKSGGVRYYIFKENRGKT